MVPGRTARGDGPLLQSPQEVYNRKGDRGRESGVMEGVCDEMGEIRSVGFRGWTLVGRENTSCRSRADDDLGGREENGNQHASRMVDRMGRKRWWRSERTRE